MSDPKDEHLEEDLARITARAGREELSSRDPREEDAALRESWLALGRLLDAANEDFDEAALIAKLGNAAAEATPSRRPKPLGRWIGVAAIAASLLIAAVVWRAANRDREHPARDSVAQPAPNDESDDLAGPGSATFDDQYAWDDSLDERIADASEQLIYTAAEWRGYDAPYAAIDQRMQDLHEALGEEPL